MKRCLDQAKPDLLFLQETKLKGQLSLPKGVLANGNGAFWMLLVHLEA
jgi:exonuclease III